MKDWLQQALSCVTDAVLTVSPNGYQPSDAPHRLSLGDGTPVLLRAPLSSGATRVGLSVFQAYRIVRAGERSVWRIQTVAYQYALDDSDRREILAYHWHPHIENVVYPHLHINRGAVPREVGSTRLAPTQIVLLPEMAQAHLPTRRIALEDMLRLLIEQFRVEPIRRDWDAVLQRTRESFKVGRTWV